MKQFTIFYDGTCPLCVAEMTKLARYNHQQSLVFADIYQEDFQQRYPHIDPEQANTILHGQWTNEQVILGLDVTVTAWKLVNKHNWLVVLRWPLVRYIADWCYLFFAKHRYRISFLLLGQRRCQNGQCQLPATQSSEKKS